MCAYALAKRDMPIQKLAGRALMMYLCLTDGIGNDRVVEIMV